MNLSKQTFAAPCFSGECGFCPDCCDKEVKQDEIACRIIDLKKFMGIKRVNDEREHYEKEINNYASNTGYCNPGEIGFAKRKTGNCGMKYKLIQKEHQEICDDPICKVIYESSDDQKKRNKYPKYPLYERVNTENQADKKHYLCGICVFRE